jgi:hypothetical protein
VGGCTSSPIHYITLARPDCMRVYPYAIDCIPLYMALILSGRQNRDYTQ